MTLASWRSTTPNVPWPGEDDFFLPVVAESPGARVLDLGVGTGRLALGTAAAGHTVTGVDPAQARSERGALSRAESGCAGAPRRW
ncbi:hypothetical protein J7E88_11475 [Streptomyces sp. ISL-10]|uniref:class I SAM-dependent methyltransferase n=1 Tax=Streptomyces sp. ISL-10 TaxID=2819172 RepID=UPI001BE8BCB6|nr:hypothetical protein [Streptomyces sp. ISL-10]MBT2365909.1 hypothetical protein [Streptomyces sp. ISL-10]